MKTVYPPQTKFAGGIKNSIPTTNKVCGGIKIKTISVFQVTGLKVLGSVGTHIKFLIIIKIII